MWSVMSALSSLWRISPPVQRRSASATSSQLAFRPRTLWVMSGKQIKQVDLLVRVACSSAFSPPELKRVVEPTPAMLRFHQPSTL